MELSSSGSRFFSLKKLPLVYLGACINKAALEKAGNKIVVCDDSAPLQDAIDGAKVAAGLFMSNSPTLEYSPRFTSPGVIITPEDGLTLLNYIKQNSNPIANLRFQETILGLKPAPAVALYSSRGPSSSCPNVLKPDIIAPGNLILASWSLNASVGINTESHKVYDCFNIISGSSMSCPHAAGIAALLKGAHRNWSPATIRSAMMTTATVLDNTLKPIIDLGAKNKEAATPSAMGAGHIDPNKALDPRLIYDARVEDYLRLLCTMNFTKEQMHMISRSSSIDCSNADMDLNYPSFIAFFNVSTNGVRKFKRTVTNVGDASVSYTAKVKQMKGLNVTVVPDKLVFGKKYEKQSFSLILEGHMEDKQDEVLHGSLSWVDEKGKYEVRSPIVATTLS